MGVLRIIKGEDLVKEIERNIEGIPTFERLYISLVKGLKGKKILID